MHEYQELDTGTYARKLCMRRGSDVTLIRVRHTSFDKLVEEVSEKTCNHTLDSKLNMIILYQDFTHYEGNKTKKTTYNL